MATLQRFKLLATQCGVSPSPTRSPRTSPVVHLRRRKSSLRMLLSGRRSPTRRHDPLPPPLPPLPKKRDTLKDLFGSSRTASFAAEEEEEEEEEKSIGIGGNKCEVYRMKFNRLGEPGGSSPRPGWIGFRHRVLIRKAWRPMLAGIPEDDE